MPLFMLFTAAGIVIGFLGLTMEGDLRLIGIACLAIGVLGMAATATHRREKDRLADQADRERAERADRHARR